MYEDIIAGIMQDMQADTAAARANALRGKQPPPQPQPPPQGGPLPPAVGVPTPSLQMPGTEPMAPPPGMRPPPMNLPPQAPPAPIPEVPGMAPGRPPGAPQPQQAPQALPRALGAAGGPSGGPGAAVAPQPPAQAGLDQYDIDNQRLQGQQEELMRRYEAAMQPADRSGMEAAYMKRAQAGPRALAMALAAENVGEKGLSAHFYKQAGEMDEPMKTAGGVMTPQGFIENPDYAREFTVKKIEARMAQNYQIQQSNATLSAKERARKENDAFKAQLANQANDTKLYLGGLAHSDRVAAQAGKDAKTGGGKILPVKAVNDLTDLQGKADMLATLGREFKDEYAGVGGAVMNVLGKGPIGTDANEFWKNYRKESELIERHALFGAALTAPEQAAWRSADISPGMDPAIVRRNLERRRVLAEKVFSTSVTNLNKSGYNTDAFQAIENTAAPPGPGGPAAPAAAAAAAPPPAAPAGAPRTATGPNGQKLQLVNGKWVPM